MERELAIWLIFAACVALSFVLSGMEAGVFALSRLRIRQQMRAGKPWNATRSWAMRIQRASAAFSGRR